METIKKKRGGGGGVGQTSAEQGGGRRVRAEQILKGGFVNYGMTPVSERQMEVVSKRSVQKGKGSKCHCWGKR